MSTLTHDDHVERHARALLEVALADNERLRARIAELERMQQSFNAYRATVPAEWWPDGA